MTISRTLEFIGCFRKERDRVVDGREGERESSGWEMGDIGERGRESSRWERGSISWERGRA